MLRLARGGVVLAGVVLGLGVALPDEAAGPVPGTDPASGYRIGK